MVNQNFHYIEPGDIDHDAWDEDLGKCVNENPFAYSSWLNTVCRKWAAVRNKDGSVFMPVPLKKKFGITYVSQPVFTQQLGLFSSSRITAAQITQALEAIPKKFLKIHLQLNTANFFDDLHLHARPTYCLGLKQEHAALVNKYHLNLKRNIAKAKKSSLVVKEESSAKEFVKKFRQTTGKKDAHLKPADYELMAKLIKLMMEEGKGRMLNCYSEDGEIVAGLFYLQSKTRIVNLFNFSTTDGRTLNAMPLLIDHWIALHAGSRLTLDFEGSSIPSIATFYSRFGAEKKLYPVYSKGVLRR
jgi:hypothetical protein